MRGPFSIVFCPLHGLAKRLPQTQQVFIEFSIPSCNSYQTALRHDTGYVLFDKACRVVYNTNIRVQRIPGQFRPEEKSVLSAFLHPVSRIISVRAYFYCVWINRSAVS